MAKFEASGIKELDFMTVGIFFLKNKKICIENVAGEEQDLAFQQFSPWISSTFSEYSNRRRTNLLFDAEGLKLGISFYFRYILSIFGIL